MCPSLYSSVPYLAVQGWASDTFRAVRCFSRDFLRLSGLRLGRLDRFENWKEMTGNRLVSIEMNWLDCLSVSIWFVSRRTWSRRQSGLPHFWVVHFQLSWCKLSELYWTWPCHAGHGFIAISRGRTVSESLLSWLSLNSFVALPQSYISATQLSHSTTLFRSQAQSDFAAWFGYTDSLCYEEKSLASPSLH